MKLKAFLFAAIAVLLAVGGAFATKKANVKQQIDVHYFQNADNTGPCLQIELEGTCNDDANACIEVVPIPSAPDDARELFKDELCQDPYLGPRVP